MNNQNISIIQLEIAANLKAARESKNINILKVAEDLKIRRHYLLALENGAWNEIPGNAYLIGYLKTYAKYLGLNFELEGVFNDKTPSLNTKTNLNQEYINYKTTLIIFSLSVTLVIIISILKQENIANVEHYLKTIRYDDPSIQSKQFLK